MKPLNWKKNFFSNAAWLACLLLTGYGVLVLVWRWLSESGLSGNVALYGITGGVLLFAGLLNVFVWLLRKKSRDNRDTERDDWVIRLLEKIFFLVVLVLGLYLRWERIPFAEGAEYFELASVKAGQGVPVLLHGAEYLYVLALHGICFVLGNNLVFCVWFHIFLQVLAGFLCLLGVRRLTGSFSAIAFAAYYFLSPGMIGKAVTLSPVPLFLSCFGIGLLAAGWFLKKATGSPRGYFISGMIIAIVMYLDVSGLVLLGILLTVFFVDREEPESFWNLPVVSLLTALAGFGVVLASVFALDAAISGLSVAKVAGAYGNLYRTAGNPSVDPLLLLLEMQGGQELLSLLFMLLALGVFSYFFKKKQERISVWIIAGGILLILEILGMTTPSVNGMEIILLCLCALSGTALSNYGRETVTEKVGMRKWDPSLYGIEEDEGEKGLPEENVAEQYEGESTEYQTVETPGEEDWSSQEEQSPSRKGGNLITRIIEERKRKKEEKQREAERVLGVLSSLSEDMEVSISPDHSPGEALVKGPGREGMEESEETSQPIGGKKKGFLGKKADKSVKAASRASKDKTGDGRKDESMESAMEHGDEALSAGRKPLHNPLPVPKKKVATMLDYDYEVSDDDDYDYD